MGLYPCTVSASLWLVTVEFGDIRGHVTYARYSHLSQCHGWYLLWVEGNVTCHIQNCQLHSPEPLTGNHVSFGVQLGD